MRQIICDDSQKWLVNKRNIGSIVVALADAGDPAVQMTVNEWYPWFCRAAALCMVATTPTAPCIFLQFDRKEGGRTIPKSHILCSVAEDLGMKLLWHKIALRRKLGAVDLFRPTFFHMLAFTQKGKPGKASPDVIDGGPIIYHSATGIHASAFAVNFAAQYADTIVDPMCGRGTIPALAESIGKKAIGIDIDPEQCKAAEALKLTMDGLDAVADLDAEADASGGLRDGPNEARRQVRRAGHSRGQGKDMPRAR